MKRDFGSCFAGNLLSFLYIFETWMATLPLDQFDPVLADPAADDPWLSLVTSLMRIQISQIGLELARRCLEESSNRVLRSRSLIRKTDSIVGQRPGGTSPDTPNRG